MTTNKLRQHKTILVWPLGYLSGLYVSKKSSQ